MAVGNTNQAVEELTKLIATSKEGEGIALVRQLLDQLDKEFANANMAHNIELQRVTAKNEAMLTHYLVDWSKKTPSVAKFYYAYAVYDARTQRLAGSSPKTQPSGKSCFWKRRIASAAFNPRRCTPSTSPRKP